jgi:putative transposase
LATEKGISLCGVCRQLGYSKQAYYKSLSRKKSACLQHQQIKEQVVRVRHQLPRLGTRKLYSLLREGFRQQGLKIGRDRLFELLRSESLLVVRKRKYIQTTDSRSWMHQHPNLIKEMEVSRPEQVWVADITYVTTKQGYGYLHLITDAYSKKIMGYTLSNNLAASSTLKALQMALNNKSYTGRLIHHSDRGLQYCSREYTGLLRLNDIDISMTQTGSPYDNAIAERINGILKEEFGLDETFETMQEAEKQTVESISLYNQLRPHTSNHFLTPQQMHSQSILKPKAWHKKTTRTLSGPDGFLPSPLII